MEFFVKVFAASLVVFIVAYYNGLRLPRDIPILNKELEDQYDYVIVGGGTAGCVLASRLSEDKSSSVLVLEAGGQYDNNPLFTVPAAFFSAQKTTHDWSYYTVPQNASCLGLNGQRSYWPQGRVLGGTASLNAMQYTRGSKHDFDEWAANGCDGWSYEEVKPYFLKFEDIKVDELKSSEFHGSGGPIAVTTGSLTPLADLYLQAGKELGYDITDYNGNDQDGFYKTQLMIRNGIRSNVWVEYLKNNLERENLDIATGSFATQIEIVDKRAVGVYYVRNGRKYFIKARKEVILSAGAIKTPQLLMLSGVGPKHHLEELKIDVKADLPVGQNLQDHMMLIMSAKINKSISITEDTRQSWWTGMKYNLFGKGLLSAPGSEASAFFYLNESRKGYSNADIQMVFYSLILSTNVNLFNFKDDVYKEYFAGKTNVNGFLTLLHPTRPKSTGTIKLRNRDPFEYPIINPMYLTDYQDIREYIEAIRIWERFLETPTIQGLGASVQSMKFSFCLHEKFRSDSYWECIIRHLALTASHPCGTARMGAESDPSSVVDPELRVKGIRGLRVVDASVFPNVTSGNTQAPVVMIAEKIADTIRGLKHG